MTQSLQDLEKDIEHSRAQLDRTIDQLQNKMTVSGVVDDMLGTARTSQYGPLYDRVLETVRSNPVPVMLIAAGLGLLAYRLGSPARRRPTRLIAADEDFITEQDLMGEPADMRLYEPGAAPLEQTDGMFDRRRMNSGI
ncbi:Protein of unknown function [Microvirga guangxiensis]|uniref:DUF3618 domain-containing protein n=2 Tax=Microvirga guangxiensis TaxID=549386 RepID=A0A1G5CPC0_9HYPH|nr:Protein of unknown function [Microvirga guangxiensis]